MVPNAPDWLVILVWRVITVIWLIILGLVGALVAYGLLIFLLTFGAS